MPSPVAFSKLTSTQAGGAVSTVVEPTASRAPHWNYHVHAQVTTTAIGISEAQLDDLFRLADTL